MKSTTLGARVSLALACFILLAGTSTGRANTLRFAFQGDLNSLDPHALNETFTLGMLANVYEGLVVRDHRLRLKPALAVRWDLVAPRTWRFHLRRGVTFHNGDSFSADDVLFSLERARQPGSQLGGRIPAGARFEKIDDFTIDVHLQTVDPILPERWETLLIVSKRWMSAQWLASPETRRGVRGAERNPLANGTGPFRVAAHEPGMHTFFDPNKNWWGRPGHNLERVEFYTVKRDATRTASLLSGDLDMVVPAPIQDIARIRQTTGFDVLTGPELRTIFLNLDTFRKTLVGAPEGTPNPLRDRRVRMALYQAIDVETIRAKVMRGRSQPASSLVSPLIHTGVGDIARYPFNPERSQQLLAEAGYGDGFALTMDCPNNRYVNDAAICQAVAGMLARVGIRVSLDIQPKSIFFAKVLSGGGYDTAFNLLGWTPGSLDGWNVLANLAKCRDAQGNGARFNVGGYCNPEVDQLADAVRLEPDPLRRRRMLTRAFRIIHEDVGFIPLHQQSLAWGVSRRLKIPQRADNQIRFVDARIED